MVFGDGLIQSFRQCTVYGDLLKNGKCIRVKIPPRNQWRSGFRCVSRARLRELSHCCRIAPQRFCRAMYGVMIYQV